MPVYLLQITYIFENTKKLATSLSLKVRLPPSLSSLKTEYSATFPRCGYIRRLQRDGRARTTSKTSNYCPPSVYASHRGGDLFITEECAINSITIHSHDSPAEELVYFNHLKGANYTCREEASHQEELSFNHKLIVF